MTIKEVEQLLEVPKATIRFYEKEGLLKPKRSANSYREYSQTDIEVLKKIIVLRKIGISVEKIRDMLNDAASLQDVLAQNVEGLQRQMREIGGALRVCRLMQEKDENIAALDEEYYWGIVHAEERSGNRFFELVNDVVEFEKKVVWEEFGLMDAEGKLRFSPGMSVILALAVCLAGGLVWFFLDGMHWSAFAEGFVLPFVCILLTSVFGLPLHFLEKKSEKAANMIRKAGSVLCVVFLIAVVLLMIFLDV